MGRYGQIHIDRGAERFACLPCGRRFASEHELLHHVEHEKGHEGKWCGYCIQLFPSRYVHFSHSIMHDQVFTCTFCHIKWDTKEELVADWKRNHSACYDCNAYVTDWTQHRIEKHQRFECCGKDRRNGETLEQHMEEHKKLLQSLQNKGPAPKQEVKQDAQTAHKLQSQQPTQQQSKAAAQQPKQATQPQPMQNSKQQAQQVLRRQSQVPQKQLKQPAQSQQQFRPRYQQVPRVQPPQTATQRATQLMREIKQPPIPMPKQVATQQPMQAPKQDPEQPGPSSKKCPRNIECYSRHCKKKLRNDIGIVQHLQSGACASGTDWEDIHEYAVQYSYNNPHAPRFTYGDDGSARYGCNSCRKTKFDNVGSLLCHGASPRCSGGWAYGLIEYLKVQYMNG